MYWCVVIIIYDDDDDDGNLVNLRSYPIFTYRNLTL